METGKGNRSPARTRNSGAVMEAASKRTFSVADVFEYPLGTPNKTNRGIQVMRKRRLCSGNQTGKRLSSAHGEESFPLARCI